MEDKDPSSQEQQVVTVKKKCIRLNSQAFILTFPQNATPKEIALERILAHPWPVSLEWTIVSEEKHESGDPHLHAVVKFKEALRTRDTALFDFICQKHGNYQGCRSVKESVKYVTKKGDYVTSGVSVEDFLSDQKSGKISGKIATMLMDGKNLEEINTFDSGYFLMNKRKIEDYQSWIVKRKCQVKKPWIPFTLESMQGIPLSTKKIMKWINKNLLVERPYGSKDLYIHGKTMLGKTSLTIALGKYFRTYLLPSDDWNDLYTDEEYDLAIIDEFHGNKQLQFMHQWCQGAPQSLKRRGIAPVIKNKHLPTIIISNYSLEDCYKHVYEKNPINLDPLKRRLKIVEVREFITIPWQ